MKLWKIPFLTRKRKKSSPANGGKSDGDKSRLKSNPNPIPHPKAKDSPNDRNRNERDSKSGISSDIEGNLQWIQTALGDSSDIVVRRIADAAKGLDGIAFVYIDALVDEQTVNQMILQPAMAELSEQNRLTSAAGWLDLLKNRVLNVGQVRELQTRDEALTRLLEGCTVLFIQGSATALMAGTSGGEKRSVEEPSSQTVIRGPKESFTENIKTNVSLIRRRIKSAQLRVESKQIGKQTQTNVAIVYMKGIAQDKIIEEIYQRLNRIDTDGILESAYIEEFIQDASITPFPTIENTERPDAVTAGILEGQIAIIVDGTPFVLLAPVTFVRFFQSSEDFYQRYDIASFLRIMRYVSFFVSMLLPALFIAISTYHQEMLPTPLLISLAAQREGVPFPAIVEALVMELTFEVLREAGVRMPRVIGPAISIVGALVLGQAAVQAGLISAAMVIVVSFTAIANFVIPAINMAIAARLIRFAMMILGGTLGLYGIMSGMMILLIHLAGLRSFGVPYLAPLSPFVWSNWKDTFVRVPQWAMKKRPLTIASKDNVVRQGRGQRPAPPDQNSDS